VGDKIFQDPVGRPVNWQVDFNKLGPPNQSGSFDFYYNGSYIGVDPVGETMTLAEKFGIIQKKGSWYNLYEEQIQGERKVIERLREEPALYDKVVAELHEQIK